MKTEDKKRLKHWADQLTPDQAIQALLDLIEFVEEIDIISFYDECLAPYWSSCGEPLVKGQKTYPDEP